MTDLYGSKAVAHQKTSLDLAWLPEPHQQLMGLLLRKIAVPGNAFPQASNVEIERRRKRPLE